MIGYILRTVCKHVRANKPLEYICILYVETVKELMSPSR